MNVCFDWKVTSLWWMRDLNAALLFMLHEMGWWLSTFSSEGVWDFYISLHRHSSEIHHVLLPQCFCEWVLGFHSNFALIEFMLQVQWKVLRTLPMRTATKTTPRAKIHKSFFIPERCPTAKINSGFHFPPVFQRQRCRESSRRVVGVGFGCITGLERSLTSSTSTPTLLWRNADTSFSC